MRSKVRKLFAISAGSGCRGSSLRSVSIRRAAPLLQHRLRVPGAGHLARRGLAPSGERGSSSRAGCLAAHPGDVFASRRVLQAGSWSSLTIDPDALTELVGDRARWDRVRLRPFAQLSPHLRTQLSAVMQAIQSAPMDDVRTALRSFLAAVACELGKGNALAARPTYRRAPPSASPASQRELRLRAARRAGQRDGAEPVPGPARVQASFWAGAPRLPAPGPPRPGPEVAARRHPTGARGGRARLRRTRATSPATSSRLRQA